MMRNWWMGLLSAVVIVPAGAADVKEANEAFAAGDYAKAAVAYQQEIDEGPVSAELYHNLAAALEKEGRPIDAALNYQRALILDPGLRAAHNNLGMLTAEAGIAERPRTWVSDVTAWVHPGTLINFGSLFVWLGFGGILVVVFAVRRRWVLVASVVALVLGTIFFGIGSVADPRIADANLAMVTATEGTKALASPAMNSTPVADLPAGSSVGVLSPRGAWTYVALSGGARGWVPTNSLTMVVPGKSL